jgi:hypothetical protein
MNCLKPYRNAKYVTIKHPFLKNFDNYGVPSDEEPFVRSGCWWHIAGQNYLTLSIITSFPVATSIH